MKPLTINFVGGFLLYINTEMLCFNFIYYNLK